MGEEKMRFFRACNRKKKKNTICVLGFFFFSADDCVGWR